MTAPELETRLRLLEDGQAIRRTQARYAAAADAKYLPSRQRVDPAAMAIAAAEQAACFTLDAHWDGGEFGGSRRGRTALAEWFAVPPWSFALHYYVAPQIALIGDVADTSWRLWQVGWKDGEGDPVLLAGVTAQRFVRQDDGEWLIADMRFEQLHLLPLPAGIVPAAVPPETV